VKKTFKWLNLAQFGGALNDNMFKMLAVIYLVGGVGCNLASTLAVTSALLVIPFLLFSNIAGALADRYSKRDIVIIAKWVELGIVLLGYPALLSGRVWPVFGIIFLLSAQSAFFGPSKRGIVPELVGLDELPRANGFMTGATYMAIIIGLFMPSLATTWLGINYIKVLTLCIAVSIAGLLCSYRIGRTPAANRRRKSSIWILPDAIRAIGSIERGGWLRLAVYGTILFGGITALMQQTLVVFARDVLQMEVEASGFLFPFAAIGIAGGALLTARLSPHTIEKGLISIGATSLTISIFGLSMAGSYMASAFWLLVAGVSIGMYVVPLNAFIQQRTSVERRGEIFGAIGFFSFSAMVASSILFYGAHNGLHLSARGCMFGAGVLSAVLAVIASVKLSEFTVRFWISRITKIFYQVKVSGIANLPRDGGALIICNHTSYADALLLQSATQRRIRFVMSRETFRRRKKLRFIFKLINIIPIHTKDGPHQLKRSIETVRQGIKDGCVVCVFPEGELSKNGDMRNFHKGFQKMIKGTGCPIIPAHLGNLWGSIFSYYNGKPGLKRLRRFPYPVTLRFGEALPLFVSCDEARRVVADLGRAHKDENSVRCQKISANECPHSAAA